MRASLRRQRPSRHGFLRARALPAASEAEGRRVRMGLGFHRSRRRGGGPRWKLRRICDHVEANLDRELRICDLAGIAEVTPGYFHRAFRLTTGQTPLTFINERRVQRALPLLAQADVSIAETCVRVGFVSPAHFTRVFRSSMGMNPSAYRASLGLLRSDG